MMKLFPNMPLPTEENTVTCCVPPEEGTVRGAFRVVFIDDPTLVILSKEFEIREECISSGASYPALSIKVYFDWCTKSPSLP